MYFFKKLVSSSVYRSISLRDLTHTQYLSQSTQICHYFFIYKKQLDAIHKIEIVMAHGSVRLHAMSDRASRATSNSQWQFSILLRHFLRETCRLSLWKLVKFQLSSLATSENWWGKSGTERQLRLRLRVRSSKMSFSEEIVEIKNKVNAIKKYDNL